MEQLDPGAADGQGETVVVDLIGAAEAIRERVACLVELAAITRLFSPCVAS
jgi:hypothetical protein